LLKTLEAAMADYATLLRDHTTLTCRSVDRVFLQAWVPSLQTPGLVARFCLSRGFRYPSSAALGKIGDRFVKDIEWFARETGTPVVHFKKGENKEAFAGPTSTRLRQRAATGRSPSSGSLRRRHRYGGPGNARGPSIGGDPSRTGAGSRR
jgi:hypothetical protein